MTEKLASCFASTAWWSEHPQSNPAVVHAILSLSDDDRTADDIWRSPTMEEWRHVAEVAGTFDGESDMLGRQIAWRMLLMLFEGDAQGPALA